MTRMHPFLRSIAAGSVAALTLTSGVLPAAAEEPTVNADEAAEIADEVLATLGVPSPLLASYLDEHRSEIAARVQELIDTGVIPASRLEELRAAREAGDIAPLLAERLQIARENWAEARVTLIANMAERHQDFLANATERRERALADAEEIARLIEAGDRDAVEAARIANQAEREAARTVNAEDREARADSNIAEREANRSDRQGDRQDFRDRATNGEGE